jgi:hypothetical protein
MSYHTFSAVCNAFFTLFILFLPTTFFILVYGYIPGVHHLDLSLFFSLLSSTFLYFRTQHVRDLAYHYRGFNLVFLFPVTGTDSKGHFIPL